MKLSKIKIKNYRLLIDAELEVDSQTTLIVGRNNTAKTSCFECICNVLNGNPFSFNDYPLQKRENLYTKIALFMEKKLTLEQLYEQLEPISIELLVDYTLDDPDENLGALSPFINFFIAENKGPQFGFFGDAWQTIYQSNKACGAIEHNNLMNTVEPVYKALETSNMQLLFDALEIKRYPITKKSEKARWKNFHKQLKEVRRKKAIDVFFFFYQSNLIPVPPKLEGYYRLYCDAPETIYAADTTIQSFLNLDYAQFVTAIDFMYPDAMFSTEHGVKGEEYDNVVFVIGRGWNQYQFEVYAPMITGQSAIPTGKQASYERNRNLFYVCCSRPKKRLFLFISIPIEPTFRSFLVELVGEQNIFTYSQYLESNMK